MNDLERIEQIEKTLGIKLKKVEPDKIHEKHFYSSTLKRIVFRLNSVKVELGLDVCLDINPDEPSDIAHSYCIDHNSEITGLSLDQCNLLCFENRFLTHFKSLNTLSLRYSKIDLSMLQDLSKLNSLDLSSTDLNNISVIKNLSKLKNLNLSFNKLGDVSILKGLVQLKSLDLSGNELTDGIALNDMLRLKSLDLSHNNLKDVSSLKGLLKLKSLDLSYNNLKDVSALKQLSNLNSLDLSHNNLNEVSFLKGLTQLTHLHLNDNSIVDISVLKYLSQLVRLDLRKNRISDISILKNLSQLSSLYLSNNKFSNVSVLKGLQHLSCLYLSSNNISNWSVLKDLSQLDSLDLSSTNLNDVSVLKGLSQLKTLDLSNNYISDLSGLKELFQLNLINLSHNNLCDVLVLKDLKHVKTLNLSHNSLNDMPGLKDLSEVNYLNLSHNNLTDLSFLKDLQSITSIKLVNNKIEAVPHWLTNLGLDIDIDEKYYSSCINLTGNPIVTPPIEIIKQGNQAISDWYEAEKQQLKEVKVLLVGEAKTGKTSLMRRLLNNKYNDKQEQTDGIIIESFDFEQLKTFKKQKGLHGIKAYFWDFGGQEIMHSTHQFFMTKRSLYILVLEARKDEKADQQVRKWLKKITAFGGDSQVLVVINKIEVNKGFGLDESQLKKDFPQIQGFYRVSCKRNKKLGTLKKALAKHLPQTDLFHTEIDRRWLAIKEDLQEATGQKQYLSWHDFQKICETHDLKDKRQQESAIAFLNDLGIVLHFKDIKLNEFYVLDPYWVTSGVYRLLTSQALAENHGELQCEQLFGLLEQSKISKDQYKSEHHHIQYSPSEVRYLTNIMAEFKLCYYTNERSSILVPDLLRKNTPIEACQTFIEAEQKIGLIYQYDYMPNSIMPRLIVEMRNDIKDLWRTGMIVKLPDGKASALIQAKDDNKGNSIQITVTGQHKSKREYLSIIRFFIEKINADFSVDMTLWIPLPVQQAVSVKYDQLIKMEKAGEKTYKNWDIEQEFDISQLLDGIETQEIIQKHREDIEKAYPQQVPFKEIVIFLASSEELKKHRDAFEKFINRQNKNYTKKGIFLRLEIWEDFIDAMSREGLQAEYNKTVQQSDIFVMLFRTKVGPYTNQEFEKAVGQFEETGRPLVYTYFHKADIKNTNLNRRDVDSFFDFKDKLTELKHYPKQYKNKGALQYLFAEQLKKIMPKILEYK